MDRHAARLQELQAHGMRPVSTGPARQRMFRCVVPSEGPHKGNKVWIQTTPLPVEGQRFYLAKGFTLAPPPNLTQVGNEWLEPAPAPSAPVVVVEEDNKGEAVKPRRERAKRGN